MNVYWTNCIEHNGNFFATIPPTSLLTEYRSRLKGTPAEMYLKCPAAIDELKNTFVIRAPFDFEIHYNGSDITAVGVDDEFNREILNPITQNFEVLAIGPGLLFFSEENLTLTQLPAYAHASPLDHVMLTPGTFNMSKWFRPIVAGVINQERKSIVIKRGDVLYYIRFNTEENVRLSRFKFTPQMQKFCEDAVFLKKLMPTNVLKTLYSLFVQSRRDKEVLRAIKENLM